jgi:hypothetical protein
VRRVPGQLPDARGHRHVGGRLGTEERERHVGAIALVVGAIATIASAVTTYAASQAQADAADYNRKVLKNQAEAEASAANAAAAQQREQDRKIIAAQRARSAGSGVYEEEGAPLLAQVESTKTAALNEARIRWAGENRVQGLRAEAILQGFYASTARRQGYLAAGTRLLSGAASALGSYSGGSGGSGGGGGDAGYSTSSGYQDYRAGERRTY